MAGLGREMSRSIISRHCALHEGRALDGSPASLPALDRYLALLAPRSVRRDDSEPWITRTAVLVGAYVGEVLRESVGGEWLDASSDPRGPDDYRLKLRSGVTATPVATVVGRLTGRDTGPLGEYVKRLSD
jgi:hypothetical protein